MEALNYDKFGMQRSLKFAARIALANAKRMSLIICFFAAYLVLMDSSVFSKTKLGMEIYLYYFTFANLVMLSFYLASANSYVKEAVFFGSSRRDVIWCLHETFLLLVAIFNIFNVLIISIANVDPVMTIYLNAFLFILGGCGQLAAVATGFLGNTIGVLVFLAAIGGIAGAMSFEITGADFLSKLNVSLGLILVGVGIIIYAIGAIPFGRMIKKIDLKS